MAISGCWRPSGSLGPTTRPAVASPVGMATWARAAVAQTYTAERRAEPIAKSKELRRFSRRLPPCANRQSMIEYASNLKCPKVMVAKTVKYHFLP